MLKHHEDWGARLASIDGSLAVIARCCAYLLDRGLLEKFMESLPDAAEPTESPDAVEHLLDDGKYIVTESEIQAGLWMPRKEAWLFLCVVKSTLEDMITAGELTAYHRVGDRGKKRPRVWLRRTEVEKHYGDYTLFRGKEK